MLKTRMYGTMYSILKKQHRDLLYVLLIAKTPLVPCFEKIVADPVYNELDDLFRSALANEILHRIDEILRLPGAEEQALLNLSLDDKKKIWTETTAWATKYGTERLDAHERAKVSLAAH